ncbi:hypothetical protein MMC31_000460, partial [Peltigera leucophlebia]|nr:hypothetical protein [Peltigera leucophlebia]
HDGYESHDGIDFPYYHDRSFALFSAVMTDMRRQTSQITVGHQQLRRYDSNDNNDSHNGYSRITIGHGATTTTTATTAMTATTALTATTAKTATIATTATTATKARTIITVMTPLYDGQDDCGGHDGYNCHLLATTLTTAITHTTVRYMMVLRQLCVGKGVELLRE